MTGKELVPHRDTAMSATGGKTLLPAIKGRVADLMVSFATASTNNADRGTLMRLYAESVAAFPEAITVAALDWLKLHNPRNPFHPTPQDLFEACENFRQTWSARVVAYFTDATTQWPQPSYFAKRELPWGSPPLHDGCPIPAHMVREFLAVWLADAGDEAVEKLADAGRGALHRVPAECFKGGQHNKILDLIAERERRAAAAELERSQLAAMKEAVAKLHAADGLDNAAWRLAAESYLATLKPLRLSPPIGFREAWLRRFGKWPEVA